MRKSLGERVTELEHTKRRADQYETEVKKLRGRVEELKRDLATAEDEVCIYRPFNPFTVPACNISRLNDAQKHIFQSYNIYFQCYAF